MDERFQKSKRQSDGKDESSPESHTFLLDENLCECRPIQEVFEKHGIKYERILAHFARGTEDTIWLPWVSQENYVLIGKDQHLRYNELEKFALLQHKVRVFQFSNSQLNKEDMARAIEISLPAILGLLSRLDAPFVATMTKAGKVHVRWDSKGTVAHRRAAKKRKKRLQTASHQEGLRPVSASQVREALAEWPGDEVKIMPEDAFERTAPKALLSSERETDAREQPEEAMIDHGIANLEYIKSGGTKCSYCGAMISARQPLPDFSTAFPGASPEELRKKWGDFKNKPSFFTADCSCGRIWIEVYDGPLLFWASADLIQRT